MTMVREQSAGTPGVLVVADLHDDLKPFTDSLRDVVAPIEVTTDEDHALSVIERGGPLVLALAFSQLERSLVFYLRAIKRGPADAAQRQTIVFCNRSEAARAYELCRDAVVDDYLVARPVYDVWQLALSIKQARDRLAIRRWMQDVTAVPPGQKGVAECVAELEAAVAAQAPGHPALERALADVRRAVNELDGHLRHGAHLVEELRAARHDATAAIPPHAPAAASASITPSSQASPTVLVVDDEDMSRRVVRRSLESAGYRVLTAKDGPEGLALVEAEHVDLVLMDVEMPGLSGLEVTRRLRDRWSAHELPIIMLTGHAEEQTVMSALEAGASDFVVKPGTRMGLLAKVERGLRASGR